MGLKAYTIARPVQVITLTAFLISPEKLAIEPSRNAIGVAELRCAPVKCPL
jgi:hypothetical protein